MQCYYICVSKVERNRIVFSELTTELVVYHYTTNPSVQR